MNYLNVKELQIVNMEFEKRAKEHNCLINFDKAPLKVSKDRLRDSLNCNQNLVENFKRQARYLIENIKKEYIFVLTDSGLVVLAHTKASCLMQKIVAPGISFSEKSIGLSAVSLAKIFKKPVCFNHKKFHSLFKKSWHSLAFPLETNNKIVGYLGAFTEKQKIKDEMILLIGFWAKYISGYHRGKRISKEIKISQKKKAILKLMAKGYTAGSIAMELGISQACVKYHKKKIFKILGATCSAEAIYKACKYKLI